MFFISFDFDGKGNVTHHINEGITQYIYTKDDKLVNLKDESGEIAFVFTIVNANTLETEMMGTKYTYLKKE